ncbi:MAG: CofH family radical SAM protein [Opitutales bacterium]|nr:CofH family radical SAM protein [Opitutales bacterium]
MSRFFESQSDIERALTNMSLCELGKEADIFRKKLNLNKAFYTVNGAVTYSNSCELLCPICAFGRAKGAKDAYILSIEEAVERTKTFKNAGAVEVHIIGGINHDIPFSYYLDLIRAVKGVDEKINVVAFTVSECVMMSEIKGKSLEYVYKSLRDAGLGAIPGGGAEIFDSAVRGKITPKKLSGADWLNAQKTAHKCGIKTNATMLYGHVENAQNVAEHLKLLRDLQDETNGFKAFVPLPFRKGANCVIPSKSSAVYDCKICSLARLALDNFPHIRVPVPHFTERFCQVLLNFGADDIGGTHWHEEVASSAGAKGEVLSEKTLVNCIQSAGFVPVKTNSNYE